MFSAFDTNLTASKVPLAAPIKVHLAAPFVILPQHLSNKKPKRKFPLVTLKSLRLCVRCVLQKKTIREFFGRLWRLPSLTDSLSTITSGLGSKSASERKVWAPTMGFETFSLLIRREVNKMKSLIVTVAVLLTAFGCSTSGSVQSNQQSGQTGVAEQSYAGQITSMNQAGDRIVVNGAEGDKSFVLSSSTVKPNGGLHVNERVTVNYSEIDGRLVVYAVGMPQPYHVSKELEEHFIREIRRN